MYRWDSISTQQNVRRRGLPGEAQAPLAEVLSTNCGMLAKSSQAKERGRVYESPKEEQTRMLATASVWGVSENTHLAVVLGMDLQKNHVERPTCTSHIINSGD